MQSSPTLVDTNPASTRPTTQPGFFHTRLHIVAIVCLWLVIYLPSLFRPALLDDADSVHAEAAREMLVRHDWTTLYVNGFRYLEKAPLMYWSMALSYKIFGVSDAAARLPLSLTVLGLMFSAYFFGKRYFNARAGLYSAVILGTSFGPYIFTRILIPDLVVGWFLLIGFDFFLRGLAQERPSLWSCWGLAISAALNVLTKGLIGLVFPGGIILAYLVLTGNLRHLLRMRLISSFAVFLVVAAPWHIAAGLANPAAGESRGFFWFYFVNEHFLRYLNKRFPRDYDTVPFWIFWGTMLIWIMPWSAFVFKALGLVPAPVRKWVDGLQSENGIFAKLRRVWTNLATFGRSLDARGRALLICALWALVILVFFSFSSRQEYYTLPAVPGLALILSAWLADEEASSAGSRIRRAGKRAMAVVMVLAIPAFIAAMALLWYSESVPPGTELSDVLTKHPEMYALSFGHIFDLTPKAMGLFRWPLALTGISLLGGAFAGWWLRRKEHVGASNFAITVMMAIVLLCAHQGLVTFAPVLTSKKLSDALVRVYKPGDIVVINGAYEDGSTLNFYGHFQLHVINTRTNGNLYYGSLFPDSPKIFEDFDSFAQLWKGPSRVFLWTEDDKAFPPVLKETGYVEIARSGGKLILSNRPNR